MRSEQRKKNMAPETNYKDHHDPRNEDCPHNTSADLPCECKAKRNRKPYRVVKVTDRSVGHGIRPQFITEIHPDGRLVIREQGRRHRVETTLGTVYENCLMRDALCAIAVKKQAKKDRRKARRAKR